MDLPTRPRHTLAHQESSRFSNAQIRQDGPRFGSTHVTGGSVIQGNFVGLTINSTAAARPEYVGQFAYSTLEPVKAFVPRTTLHNQIQTQLCHHVTDNSTKTLVVWGLGGAGKTQLVLDYVRQHRTEYKATFWIEAGRKELLERDFIHLYQTLFGLQTATGSETILVDNAVTGVKSWFAGRQGPWLMVFDGADAIEDRKASDFIDIRHFIPDVASLHVIITSRSGIAKDMTRLEGLQVGEMDEVQAVELFYQYAQLPRDNAGIKEEVKAVVKELEYLALAITLAAAYVGTTPRLQSDIKAFLPDYMQRRRKLLSRKPESLVHQYNESVLTTWETSYQALHDQCPEASYLMTMLSFLSFDDIFLGLLGAITMHVKVIEPSEADDQQSYTMHKLVHAWGYNRLSEEQRLVFSQLTFKLIMDVLADCRMPIEKLRLVPHAMAGFSALADTTSRSDRVTKDLIDEVEKLGLYMGYLGRWSEQYTIQEFVLEKRHRLLGDEHPDTIIATSNLVRTLGSQGQLDMAARMGREVLKKSMCILGDEHPTTISAIAGLALTLTQQGQQEEAVKMMGKVLEKSMHAFGEDHIDTIEAMANLGTMFGSQGRLDEAAKMNREVLEKLRRMLGEEHPNTTLAMNSLANTLYEQGHLEEAAEMRREVLEKLTQTLGKEHPDTILAMGNLAITLMKQGQLGEATRIMKEVLEKRKSILGEEHPDTILAISVLASMLEEQGQLKEAARIKKKVLEKRRLIYGEEHPDTILAINNLSITLRKQGQLEEATKLRREVLEKRIRISGEEHLDTISTMNTLANMLGEQGQLEEAAKMMKEVLEKRMRIFGEDHIDTIEVMAKLGMTLGIQGQLDEAAIMMKEVLGKRRSILGPEHPDTISVTCFLAVILKKQGQLEEAMKMMREVLEDMTRILGEGDPKTKMAAQYLADLVQHMKPREHTTSTSNLKRRLPRLFGIKSRK